MTTKNNEPQTMVGGNWRKIVTMSKATNKKPAKTCYSHLGGKLGTMLLENFKDKGWILKEKPTDKHFYITEKGQKEFAKLGLDLSQIKSENK